MLARAALFVTRWSLILLLSVVVMFPPVFAIVSWGVESAEKAQHAGGAKPPAGQRGRGLGVAGLNALIAYTVGSFVVIWPLSLWASYRLLRGVGQKRREPKPKPPEASLIRIEPQVLGAAEKSAPGTDLAELRGLRSGSEPDLRPPSAPVG